MKYLSVDRWNPEKDVIFEAADILRAGGLVAFPTETVYGLGANGLDEKAVMKIFEAKGRPADNPLILHISNPSEADDYAYVNERARCLMDRFFPGALTLVLRSKPVVPGIVTANLETVALRMPFHPVPLALIESLGSPIAAPSANRSGRPSPTDAQAVLQDAGKDIDIILDGGICDIGMESTVIDVSGENVCMLRPGGVPVELIEEFLREKLTTPASEMIKGSPGTRYKHYAPFIPLLLWEKKHIKNEKQIFSCSGNFGYIGLNQPDFYCDGLCIEKIIFSSVENYARGVFASFRSMEKIGVSCIIAEVPDKFGIGRALKDRLFRAAGLNSLPLD